MAIGNIDSACSAYLLSEKQLQRHYQSVKIGFPALPWTPEPRIHNHIYISPSHKRFLRQLHPQSKQKTLSKQTLDLLRPPMVEGHRKRPGGFKISDPRFTSPQATWKAKIGDKRGNHAEQMVTLLEDWPRTPRYMRAEPESKVAADFKIEDLIREISRDRGTCGQLFPARGRKHQPPTLHGCASAEKPMCTFTKSLSAKRMQYRSKSPLPIHTPLHDRSMKLADDDDEFKCVIEGDPHYPFIHL